MTGTLSYGQGAGQPALSPNQLRMKLWNIACFALSGYLVLHAGETEWPQFRGPTGQGISAASGVPIEWSEGKNIAWRMEPPGRGWSSPVLSHGRLYITSAVTAAGGSDTTLHAICIDAADGRVVWDSEVFHPDAASVSAMHSKNSAASPTPIVSDGRLYVHFGHMGTAALDLDGKVLWRQNGVKYAPVHGNGGSPILLDGMLIFGCDGADDPALAALDASTGELRWKTARNTTARKHFSFCTPLAIQVKGATEVISPCSGFVGGYNPADGRELWRVLYGEGYSVVPRPVFAHGLLFVSSGFDAPVLYAIKPDGAAGDATADHVVWTDRKGAPCTPSALVAGNDLYFVSDGGIATCADPETGAVRWRERLGGGFSASPFAAEGRVYFTSESGETFIVKTGDKYELLATNAIGERVLASCAVCDGALFLRTETHLVRVKK